MKKIIQKKHEYELIMEKYGCNDKLNFEKMSENLKQTI